MIHFSMACRLSNTQGIFYAVKIEQVVLIDNAVLFF